MIISYCYSIIYLLLKKNSNSSDIKKLNLLKTLLDLIFFFSIFAVGSMVIVVPFLLRTDDTFPVNIKGQECVADDLFSQLMLIPLSISALLFLYAIYLLRENVRHFAKMKLVQDQAIVNFNKIGVSILVSTFLSLTAMFWYDAIKGNRVSVGISGGGFDCFILSVALGLFFVVPSEVFKIAKDLKEENDLTL